MTMTSEQLKASIIQLAMEGKLVPQNPDDESVDDLLENIKAEKERLIAEEKIKKEKPLPEITEDEIPFQIPANWKWVRLCEISNYIQRGKSPKYSDIHDVPVISQKSIQWSGFDISPSRFINNQTLSNYEDVRLLKKNDLLWNSTGTGTIGRILKLTEFDFKKFSTMVADSHVTVIRLSNMLNQDFVEKYLQSPTVQNTIENLADGSTNQIELSKNLVVNRLVPLPPLAEQERIVAKLEELFAQVDEYGLAYKKLEKLNGGIGAKLKASVLQFAMQGKLVPQDPDDEPVEELLKRIDLEKKQMIATGKVKKAKPLPPITENEIPFQIPSSWKWVRLGEIASIVTGGTPSKNNTLFWKNNDIDFIKPTQLRSDIILPAIEFIDKNGINKTSTASNGDLLFQGIGDIGRISCVDRFVAYNQQIHGILIKDYSLDFKYIQYALLSPYIHTKITDQKKSTTISIFNATKLANVVLPLPPLLEQKHVVSLLMETFNNI